MQIKFFKNKKSFKKENFQINPDYFWLGILFLTFLMIVGAFVFGFFVFKKTNQEIISPRDNIGGQIETVKKERIDKILKYFSDRETKTNNILEFPSSIVDPSL